MTCSCNNRWLPPSLLRLNDHVSFHCTMVGQFREGRYSYRPTRGHLVTFFAEKKVEWLRSEKLLVTVVSFTGQSFEDVRMAYEAFRLGKVAPSQEWSAADASSEEEPPKKGDSGQHALDLAPTSVTPSTRFCRTWEKQVA